MIKFFFILTVFFTYNAHADWVKITETDTAVHYVDSNSVRKIGNIRLVWELQNLKVEKRPAVWWQEKSLLEMIWRRPMEVILGPPEKKISFRYRSEYNCENSTWRVSFYSSHSGPMATGKILKQVEPDYDWAYASPNTPAMNILKKVCRK